MYLETCRLGFLAVGVILIVHLVLQICEEKEELRVRRMELRNRRQASKKRRRVRFAQDVEQYDDIGEYAPAEEEEGGSNGHTFVNDGVEVSVVPRADDSASPPPRPNNVEQEANYYDDLKKELQHWIKQENKHWASSDSASDGLSQATAAQSTSIDALPAAGSPGPAPVKAATKPVLQKEESRNVNLKINMINEASRHPNVSVTELDANIVPGCKEDESNVMNSGNLGGGLSAWDTFGSSYGSV